MMTKGEGYKDFLMDHIELLQTISLLHAYVTGSFIENAQVDCCMSLVIHMELFIWEVVSTVFTLPTMIESLGVFLMSLKFIFQPIYAYNCCQCHKISTPLL